MLFKRISRFFLMKNMFTTPVLFEYPQAKGVERAVFIVKEGIYTDWLGQVQKYTLGSSR